MAHDRPGFRIYQLAHLVSTLRQILLTFFASTSTHGMFLLSPRTLTLEDLAGASFRWPGLREFDPAWNLVIGQRAAAMTEQIIQAEDLFRLQHEVSHHEFAPGIRYAEDRRHTDCWTPVSSGFNLARVRIFAASDNFGSSRILSWLIRGSVFVMWLASRYADVAELEKELADRGKRLVRLQPRHNG